MLTVAEMARNIGVPATTAREYVGRFKEFFPTKKVSGKRYPMHPETAELIMRDIVDSYARHMTTDDVTNLLKEKYPMDADIVDDEVEPNGKKSAKSSSPTKVESNALEVISRMSTMQMQLMQKMTEVLDRNNQVMERVIDALDKTPRVENGKRRHQLPEGTMPHDEAGINKALTSDDTIEGDNHEAREPVIAEVKTSPPPKKFIMPSKEDIEKRRPRGGLFSKIFGG